MSGAASRSRRSPQDLVERALGPSTTDGCIVIVSDNAETNLRWANNTLTTNGVNQTVDVTVIATVNGPDGVRAESASRNAVDADSVVALVAEAEANARDSVVADDVIAGLRQLVDRAHVHGIKVMGATILPYTGAAYFSDTGDQIREAVNRWIRTGGAYDAVVDFEAATRDPNNPKLMRAEFDSGDHLHPNDAGYKAMADAIDLSIFGRQQSTSTSARTR